MNIGFYGHSNCAYRSEHSFLDIVAKHYNANIVNVGVKQGSEERILFELKKTKFLDLAIIFHCHHSSLFIPHSDRDIHINSVDEARTQNLFTQQNNPIFSSLFETDENLYYSIETYRNYFYHKDLMLNRYYGALIQIDQYLTFKNIKCIHVLDSSSLIPTWFKFNAYVDTDIMKIAQTEVQKNPFFVNCISLEGNRLIANKLIEIIDTL